ncbi:hypothetical protein C5Y96_02245 [Blastopirellula marina]|uniref:Uncharacterized protein n=1 Tax=Blastopirellula marina TaxID=124 RepID=A0A2S8G2P1_9BACT|nr:MULTISPECIES: hypothetical protein [Pirellulaceae]PQO38722.1 hypothetical protein C5Y96_02245 [Blastopirellula marina]RCS55030.1 hypothetical protein DTL36_02250 [Bremerella cremea]
MIEEQEPLPDVPEPDEPYRRPVDAMSLPQIEAELRDLFGGAVMYLLIPIFLLSLSTTTIVATPFFVRVLPAAAIVFVGYWVLQKAYVPMLREAPETALQYLRVVSRLGGGVMSTPHERVVSLCAQRTRLKEGNPPES